MKAASGTFKKVHAIRIEPGEDVMECLLDYCKKNQIGHGVIVSGIGSLDGCSFFDPAEIPGKPGLYGYGDAIELPSPIELIAMNGIICTDGKKQPSLHIHAAFADMHGREYGGHFKEGNRVLTTVELVIAEFDGISMTRTMDPIRGVPVFVPIQL